MATGDRENLTYEFGAFRLDPAERLLLRDGQVVPLTPKAFDLLVYLVEHHGRLVEKSTLMSAVWSDAIVEESNLAYTVSMLRRVLDVGGDAASIIQTVPTRGYRFVAAVSLALGSRPDPESRDPTPAEPESVAESPMARPARRKTAVTVAAVALLGVLGGMLAWHRLSSSGSTVPTSQPEPVLTRLTANPADLPVTSAHISPDGRYLAFADPAGIQMRQIDTGETQRLPETRGMSVYGWSGDSAKVRAGLCEAATCVGWDVSLVGGARRRSGVMWAEGDEVMASPDGSRLLRRTLSGEAKLDLLNGSSARVIASSVLVARWRSDGSRNSRRARA